MLKLATLTMSILGLATVGSAAVPMLYEERIALIEETQIIPSPIAGIQNQLWFDYRINV